MNVQHPFQADRAATVARLRVVRLNRFTQRLPRHEGVHIDQESGLPRHATMRREVRRFQPHAGKASLFHLFRFNELISLITSTKLCQSYSVFP